MQPVFTGMSSYRCLLTWLFDLGALFRLSHGGLGLCYFFAVWFCGEGTAAWSWAQGRDWELLTQKFSPCIPVRTSPALGFSKELKGRPKVGGEPDTEDHVEAQFCWDACSRTGLYSPVLSCSPETSEAIGVWVQGRGKLGRLSAALNASWSPWIFKLSAPSLGFPVSNLGITEVSASQKCWQN